MKFATKIGMGFAFLITCTLGLLIYQGTVLYRTQSLNRRLSEVSLEALHQCHQLRQALELIEEFTGKFFVTRDPDYAREIGTMQAVLSENLNQLSRLKLGEQENAVVRSFSQRWDHYLKDSSGLEAVPIRAENEALRFQSAYFQHLGDEAEQLAQILRQSIASQVQEATRSGWRAEGISILVATLLLAASGGIAFAIVHSVSSKLNQLARGTRAVARGRFEHRLEADSHDEFSAVARNFNRMAEKLGELDQMKKDFVSHVSHELRTPLGSIQESLQLLLEGVPGSLTSKQKRLLQLNLQGAQRLSLLIRNLLDMSRIEAGVMEYDLQSCDLASLVRRTVEELEPQLREKDLRLTTDLPNEPVVLKCDQDGLQRVLLNLLGNALEFSPSGEQILMTIRENVCVSLRERLPSGPNAPVLLRVADRGPGVREIEKERIFEKFHRVHPSGKGVGLGLTISRNIVEGHHGVIWVENRPSGGAAFNVLLPRQEQDS